MKDILHESKTIRVYESTPELSSPLSDMGEGDFLWFTRHRRYNLVNSEELSFLKDEDDIYDVIDETKKRYPDCRIDQLSLYDHGNIDLHLGYPTYQYDERLVGIVICINKDFSDEEIDSRLAEYLKDFNNYANGYYRELFVYELTRCSSCGLVVHEELLDSIIVNGEDVEDKLEDIIKEYDNGKENTEAQSEESRGTS